MQELNFIEIEEVSGAGFWKDLGAAVATVVKEHIEAVQDWPAGKETLFTL